MAKRFMFVCLGILALALAYHLGASTAQSNAEGPFVSFAADSDYSCMYAMTGLGEIYWAYSIPPVYPETPFPQWQYWGTITTGGTATQSSTWGQIKAQFKD